MELNQITGKIVDAAVNVHIRLGPGLFEEVYKQCMLIELKKRGLRVKSEIYMPVAYEGHLFDMGFCSHRPNAPISVIPCFRVSVVVPLPNASAFHSAPTFS